MSDQTLASSSESMLSAAQVPPTSPPINVVSSAPVVPAPTASPVSHTHAYPVRTFRDLVQRPMFG